MKKIFILFIIFLLSGCNNTSPVEVHQKIVRPGVDCSL